MTEIMFLYLLGNLGNNHLRYAVYSCFNYMSNLTSHLKIYQYLHSEINKTGYVSSLLLDTYTCDIAVINGNTTYIVLYPW